MPRRTRAAWRNLIQQYERSGQRHEEFAAKHEIPIGTLRSWIYRLRRERADGPAVLPVRVIASTAPSARQREEQSAIIEVELADETRLRFPATTPASVIAELVGLLRARC